MHHPIDLEWMLPTKQLVIGATTLTKAPHVPNTSVHRPKWEWQTISIENQLLTAQRRRLPGSFWALQYVAATGRPNPKCAAKLRVLKLLRTAGGDIRNGVEGCLNNTNMYLWIPIGGRGPMYGTNSLPELLAGATCSFIHENPSKIKKNQKSVNYVSPQELKLILSYNCRVAIQEQTVTKEKDDKKDVNGH